MTDEVSIAHIGVAVADISSALAFYQDVLGATATTPENADGATVVSLPFGGVDVELLQPETDASPVGRFIAKRGAGIHHICFRVPNLATAIRRCRDRGYVLVDEEPREGAHGKRIAFIHPASTSGILLELTE